MPTFASRTQQTIDIPFDPPQTVTVQKLSGQQLGKAQQAFFNDLVAGITARGGAKVQKDIQQLFEKDPDGATKAVAAVQADPLNGYDKASLVLYGVKAWSYEDKKVGPDTLSDLDEEALTFFAQEVLRLTKPALFASEAEREDDQKNG